MKNKILIIVLMLTIVHCKEKKTNSSNNDSKTENIDIKESYNGTGSITQGLAETKIESLLSSNPKGSRIAGVGEIKDSKGNIWTVPGINNFNNAPKAFDLYNENSGTTPNNLSELDLSSVPIAEIDADGEIITGYIFADNYFELFINGKLIAVDPVPYTPFNSNIVKFKVKTPYTIAVKVVDWEESLV